MTLILITFSTLASPFLSELKLKNDGISKETLKRIELYGLKSKERLSLVQINETEDEIKLELNNYLENDYLVFLENELGCTSNECIVRENTYRVYQSINGKVCFPGTNCEFYKCMENKYNCSPLGVNYFTELAYPTCSSYVENIKKNYFTKKGIRWIYSVMVCLQKGLVEECDINKNCEQESDREVCDHIVNYTLDFHPSCYLNSGVGVCKLPLKDKINIWRTVSPYLTDDEREQAYRTVFSCVRGDY